MSSQEIFLISTEIKYENVQTTWHVNFINWKEKKDTSFGINDIQKMQNDKTCDFHYGILFDVT